MLEQCVAWVKKNAIDRKCVPISHRNRNPYPEVTGYWIPTLLQVGEQEMAKNFARYLISIQDADGSFTVDGTTEKFVFDTGQIIRGWAAIAPIFSEVMEPMRRACEWIVSGADPVTGKFRVPPPGNMWSLGQRGEVNEGIHTYVIQPMRDAAAILNAPHIKAAADRAMASYIATLDLTHFDRPNSLTHFYAYIQEALVETGNRDLAMQGMASVEKYQLANGSVPAYHDVAWICSPGLMQLAKVWFLLGNTQRAEAALGFMRNLQNYTGGFYGSYGVFAEYFPSAEISWAPKYAIDAALMAKKGKIFIAYWKEGQNFGDDYLFYSVSEFLKAHYPDRNIYGVNLDLKECGQVTEDDLVVIAGGGVWGPSKTGNLHQSLYDAWTTTPAKLMIFNLGIESFHSDSGVQARAMLDKALVFAVRDTVSFDFIKEYDAGGKLIYGADSTFLKSLLFKRHPITKTIGFNICGPEKELNTNYYSIDHVIDALNKIRDLGFRMRGTVFSQHAGVPDIAYCKRVDPDCSEKFDAEVYCESEFFIGMSFHSVILALQNNIPVIAINYSDKVKRLMVEYGLEDYCLSPQDPELGSRLAHLVTSFNAAAVAQYREKITNGNKAAEARLQTIISLLPR